jgi:hypothetical protein
LIKNSLRGQIIDQSSSPTKPGDLSPIRKGKEEPFSIKGKVSVGWVESSSVADQTKLSNIVSREDTSVKASTAGTSIPKPTIENISPNHPIFCTKKGGFKPCMDSHVSHNNSQLLAPSNEKYSEGDYLRKRRPAKSFDLHNGDLNAIKMSRESLANFVNSKWNPPKAILHNPRSIGSSMGGLPQLTKDSSMNSTSPNLVSSPHFGGGLTGRKRSKDKDMYAPRNEKGGLLGMML